MSCKETRVELFSQMNRKAVFEFNRYHYKDQYNSLKMLAEFCM